MSMFVEGVLGISARLRAYREGRRRRAIEAHSHFSNSSLFWLLDDIRQQRVTGGEHSLRQDGYSVRAFLKERRMSQHGLTNPTPVAVIEVTQPLANPGLEAVTTFSRHFYGPEQNRTHVLIRIVEQASGNTVGENVLEVDNDPRFLMALSSTSGIRVGPEERGELVRNAFDAAFASLYRGGIPTLTPVTLSQTYAATA